MAGNVPVLLARAGECFASVQLEVAGESDLACLAEAMNDAARQVPYAGGSARLSGPLRRPPLEPREGGRLRYEARVWWRRPGCWRDDVVWEDGFTVVNVACDAYSSVYVSSLRMQVTSRPPRGMGGRLGSLIPRRRVLLPPTMAARLEECPILDASFLAHGWDVNVEGDREIAGRRGLELSFRRREAEWPHLWLGIDEYRVVADADTGVLLRYAGVVDGREAAVLRVRSVVFDDPIPDEVFDFQAPAGTRIRWTR